MEVQSIILFCLALLVGSSCLTPCEPTASQCESLCSSVRSRLLTPDNIRYFATFISPTASIQGRVIHIGPGSANEGLLKVPLGEVDPRATIVITVGLNKAHLNAPGTDSDLRVGISDGTNSNLQWITDITNYKTAPPCYPADSSSHDKNLVTPGTKVSSTFKLSFVPFYKYGACETAQDGDTINTGTFNSQVDTAKPLFLNLVRHDAPEQYYIYYLNIEIY